MSAGQKKKGAVTQRNTVAASLVSGVIAAAEVLGADRADITLCLDASGISRTVLKSPTSRVDGEHFVALLVAIENVMKEEAVGVRLGAVLAVSSFNALGYAAASCNTLFEALRLIPKYEVLVMTQGNTEIIEVGDVVDVRWSMRNGQYLAILEDLFLAVWVVLGKRLTGRDTLNLEVAFTHQSPECLNAWQEVFGSNLLFEQETAGIRFDADLLAFPILQSDPFVHRVMTKEADELASAMVDLSVASQVASSVLKQLPHGEPSQKMLASQMNISERTLRRRLQEEGTTYLSIVDAVREERAGYYLRETTLSLLEMSMLLGYQQLTAFNAAYKRWTGCTPGSVRLEC